jgi:hypothetical protein
MCFSQTVNFIRSGGNYPSDLYNSRRQMLREALSGKTLIRRRYA